MAPVLFLDFDGPLFPTRAIQNIPHNPAALELFHSHSTTALFGYTEMDPIAVHILNKLLRDTGAEVVFSTSWASFMSLQGLKAVLIHNNVEVPKFHKDPVISREGRNRMESIKLWLNKHNVTSHFAILDDPGSGSGMMTETEVSKSRIILVDPHIGIEQWHVSLLHRALTN